MAAALAHGGQITGADSIASSITNDQLQQALNYLKGLPVVLAKGPGNATVTAAASEAVTPQAAQTTAPTSETAKPKPAAPVKAK